MAPSESESRSLRLARYLRAFVALRSTTVYDVKKYEQVLWFGDMPQEPECVSAAWQPSGGQGDAWLVVQKQQPPPPPPPPEAIVPWIDGRALMDVAGGMPGLGAVREDCGRVRENPGGENPGGGDGGRDGPGGPQEGGRRDAGPHDAGPQDDGAERGRGEGRGDGSVPLPAVRGGEPDPEAVQAYERYRPVWESWAREHRRRSAVQSVYSALFRMHTQVRKQGEVLELVLALGLLAWRRPGEAPAILRHVVTARVDLSFDAATGTIRLECAADGAQLKIEDDMLDAELRPGRGHYTAVAEALGAVGDDVWGRGVVSALKSWTAALHPDSEWYADLKMRPPADDDRPVASLAPALILRKRNQVGMARIYDALIDRLDRQAGEVPPGWFALVDGDGGSGGEPAAPPEAPSSAPAAAQETYFPLPANREQRRIVDAIGRHRGVLVQGPPGTGKSHTIANLVCHLLAGGKRVLITAESGRALSVLKDKLPADMRPLCVSLLAQGADAFAELNTAVLAITTRFASWRPGGYDERIADIERELAAGRRRLAEIDAELRGLREQETAPCTLMNGAYTGTASAIGLEVAAERDRFGWLRLPAGTDGTPAVSGPKMVMWLRIRRANAGAGGSGASGRVIASNRLPAPADFAAALEAERAAAAAFEAAAEARAHPAYGGIAARSAAERAALEEALREARETRERLQRLDDRWVDRALRDALGGRQAGWQVLVEQSRQGVRDVDRLLQRLGASEVSVPDGLDLGQVRADIVVVYRHLRAGGRWAQFGFLTANAVRGRTYLRQRITVNGQPADVPERLRLVCDHIDLVNTFHALDRIWSEHGGLPPGSQPRIRAAVVKEQVANFASALGYVHACRELGRGMGASAPAIPEPDWLSGEADGYLALIDAAALEDRHRAAVAAVTSCVGDLKAARDLPGAHPAVGALLEAVERRDGAAYAAAYRQVLEVEQAGRDRELRESVEAVVGAAAPGLLQTVEDSLDDPAWNERFADWEKAWRWAAADNWLARRGDTAYRQEVWQRRGEADEAVSALLGEAAALRAWTHFFNRLTPAEAAALRAWRETVRSMGRGTGRSARIERLRQEARRHMEMCRDAIPAWIMPRYLVAEMIDPMPGRYDLVIVDEASQLGIDSLFLFYIADKMVVVGDDQQISPYGVGIPDQSIADLQRHHLAGIPFHSAFSPQSSLYANAKIRFGQSVVLREHFRCMPEIIQFSNALCYASNGTPLDPLRVYPADRLKPLLVRHVTDGYRTGGGEHAVNEPEADAIVRQIRACISDPRYEGRTIGVISLQGEAQAKLIEHRLIEALDPEVFMRHRLMCGDAYAFQGDERDVVFLSMVAAPGGTRIGVLSGDQARQRFNVAASRARDQLWLFHTATLNDLSPACMRHRLLSYMLDPVRAAADEAQARFESPFERDVFGMITDRGFHVRTQVCVGDPTNHRYRIDLVVEGMQGRLAVECDGDRWHGPERYEQDLARQRDLERAGWQFVRIRGSEFYRDRERAMEALWRELARLGIRPGGIDEALDEPPPPAAAAGAAAPSATAADAGGAAGSGARDHTARRPAPGDRPAEGGPGGALPRRASPSQAA